MKNLSAVSRHNTIVGMKKRMRIFSGVFCLFFLLPSYLSADLTKTDYEMIRVAFMNGYIRALRLDVERIQALKRSEEDLRKFVILQADRYMEEVVNLNK
jgi:hypothetical protein